MIITDKICNQPDTLLVNIKVRRPLSVSLPSDTLLCEGITLNISPKPIGGWQPYSYEWQDASQDSIYRFIATQDSRITLTVKDKCNDVEQANMNLKVRPALSITNLSDTALCERVTLILKPKGQGGIAQNYQWSGLGRAFSKDSIFTHLAQKDTLLRISLSDNCSKTISKTIALKVNPMPIPYLSISPQSGCEPLSVTLSDSSLPYPNAQYTLLDGLNPPSQVASGFSKTIQYSKSGLYQAQLQIQDNIGCKGVSTPKPIVV